jgi:hypothetical protein
MIEKSFKKFQKCLLWSKGTTVDHAKRNFDDLILNDSMLKFEDDNDISSPPPPNGKRFSAKDEQN